MILSWSEAGSSLLTRVLKYLEQANSTENPIVRFKVDEDAVRPSWNRLFRSATNADHMPSIDNRTPITTVVSYPVCGTFVEFKTLTLAQPTGNIPNWQPYGIERAVV